MGFIPIVLRNTVICIFSLCIISTAEISQFPQWSSFFEFGVSSQEDQSTLTGYPGWRIGILIPHLPSDQCIGTMNMVHLLPLLYFISHIVSVDYGLNNITISILPNR